MEAAALPLPPDIWEALPAEVQTLLPAFQTENAALQAQVVALRTENTALQARIRDLESRLGQDSSNSSRPPSSNPPQTAAKRKRRPVPSGRKRGGQPGHPGSFRPLVPIEQVDAVVVVVPAVCRWCQQPFADEKVRRCGRVWRHQVVELPPLAVRVTEYQMEARRCEQCGKRTRARLPAGVPLRPFGPRLTAVVALLSGRYRLSRREVQQLLADLWDIRLSLGAVTSQEQAQSAALAPVVAEVRTAVQQAALVNVDETGWRQEQRRAWLWTAVTPSLTIFLIDRSRGGAALEALVGEQFAGIVGSDRWSVYKRFPAERRALCWAHLKRDFQALVDRGGEAEPIGRWGLAEIARLFGLWHRLRAGEVSRKEVPRQLVPIQARMGRLLWRGEENSDRKAAALCRELNKWWEALWTFARVEGVEPTNNVAERALRPGVLWRKGSFGSDSEAGSRFAERLLTVAATCRQQGRRLLDILVAAGEAVLQGTAAPSLLPAG
jgi:transposase